MASPAPLTVTKTGSRVQRPSRADENQEPGSAGMALFEHFCSKFMKCAWCDAHAVFRRCVLVSMKAVLQLVAQCAVAVEKLLWLHWVIM